MRIAESGINLTATHIYQEETRQEESLQLWVGDRPGQQDQAPATGRELHAPVAKDIISLSAEALAKQAASRAAQQKAAHHSHESKETTSDEPEETLDPKLEALRRAVEMLTGKKIHIRRFKAPEHTESYSPQPNPNNQPPERAGWGLSYDFHASYHEEETTTFSASGVIKTADGREIAFNLELAMHREYSESTDISIRAGDAKMVDPLVINFAGTAAELTDTAFSFDIDNDGENEEMARLGSGSGFLALDRNKDGVINNGSELFGPQTGHGFEELSRYDGDHNGWIDENDAIFNDLRLWTMDASGQSYLNTLAERGIGALLLNGADTQFRLTGYDNATLGQIRESSLFVRENGSVGTMQEVDMAV